MTLQSSGRVGVYDITLPSASVRWSPIGRCRGDYAPTVAAGDCIGEEVVVEVGERGCRWVTGKMAGGAVVLVGPAAVVLVQGSRETPLTSARLG